MIVTASIESSPAAAGLLLLRRRSDLYWHDFYALLGWPLRPGSFVVNRLDYYRIEVAARIDMLCGRIVYG